MNPLRAQTATWLLGLCLVVGLSSCADEQFNFDDPARGPGDLVGGIDTVSKGDFFGGNDLVPAARVVGELPGNDTPPDCGTSCIAYCESLDLQNPVNRGVCKSLWGVGLSNQPIVRAEGCRRMYVDTIGRFPTRREVVDRCNGKTWGEVASYLITRPEFVQTNQRRWADKLLYDTQSVSVERVYDADNLVGKLFHGLISYDQFAAVVSAHPVLTRRYDTPEDRAEAMMWLFMGRPPLGTELADFSRLYTLWFNGYYDHPELQMRLPDAHIRYRCVDEDGKIDPETQADCASILWGYHQLILTPDIRRFEDENGEVTMWSGVMQAKEWEKMQLPGRLLSSQQLFWEHAVDDVLTQYLGYDFGHQVPTVQDELVRYLLQFNGDMRALHFAVLTSVPYLQSATGETQTNHRWTYGPLRQVEPEVWIDTMKVSAGYELSTCDHRLTRPDDFIRSGTIAGTALVERSRWELQGVDDRGRLRIDYGYRNIARSLGGCPDNSVGGRFKIVSILTTAQQLNFVNQVCDPAMEGGGTDMSRLLPEGVGPDTPVSADVAEAIYDFQLGLFMSRPSYPVEIEEARAAGEDCNCSAAQFARPTCFALLSSAEMLFY